MGDDFDDYFNQFELEQSIEDYLDEHFGMDYSLLEDELEDVDLGSNKT